jgi:outer membrane receptor protein involved in Fe transport
MARLCVYFLALVLVGPAFAARPRSLTANGLRGLGLDPGELEALHAAMASAVREGADTRLAAELPAQAVTCGTSTGCHCASARARNADGAVFGNVGRLGALYTIELVAVEAQGCSVANAVFVSGELSPALAPERVGDLARELLRPPQQVSQSALKGEREVARAPAAVTILTADDLSRLGITRLEDVFRLVPGFEALDANWGELVLHHGLPNTLLLMVDGIPLYDGMTAFRTLSRDFRMFLAHVDRIELVRGPGSVLYGENAFLGVVNFITRSGTRELPVVDASVAAGSYPSALTSLAVEQRRPNIRYSLFGTFHQTRGPVTRLEDSLWANFRVPTPVWGNAGATGNELDRHFQLSGKIELLERLQLLAHYLHSDVRFEISPFGSLLEPGQPGYWRRSQVILGARWRDVLSEDVRYQVAVSRFENTTWERFAIHPPSPLGHPEGFGSLQGHPAQPRVSNLFESQLEWAPRGGNLTHRLLVGVTAHDQRVPDSLVAAGGLRAPPEPAVSFTHKAVFSTAAYAHEEVGLGEHFVVSGGARVEQRNRFGTVITTRGGLLGSFDALSAKLLWDEGFRPPGGLLLWSTQGTEGNPELRPERSRALTLDASLFPRPEVTLRTVLMRAWISDLIVLDPAAASAGFAYKPVNRGRMTVDSALLEVRWQPVRALDVGLGGGWKRISESEPEGTGIAVAPWTASATVAWRPVNDVRTYVAAAVLAPRRVTQLWPDGPPEPRVVPTTLTGHLGVTVSSFLGVNGLSADAQLFNPLGLTHYTPYRVDGSVNPLLEPRTGRELRLALAWKGALNRPASLDPAVPQ